MASLAVALVAIPISAGAQSSAKFSSDVTVLSSAAAGFEVKVTLLSRTVGSVDVFPDAEPGQFPEHFRVVKSLKINVNGDDIVVPYNAYADLFWVSTAQLVVSESEGVLTVSGGDASEGYDVRIEFDGAAIRLRSLYGLGSSDEPLQQTRYFLRVLE
jgi:hypothetical protein